MTLPRVDFMHDFTMGDLALLTTFAGISPMVISMKLTHESVPFKHSVVRLYIAAFC